jgi:hypothetical protein
MHGFEDPERVGGSRIRTRPDPGSVRPPGLEKTPEHLAKTQVALSSL